MPARPEANQGPQMPYPFQRYIIFNDQLDYNDQEERSYVPLDVLCALRNGDIQ
jgi:hypothetical protein